MTEAKAITLSSPAQDLIRQLRAAVTNTTPASAMRLPVGLIAMVLNLVPKTDDMASCGIAAKDYCVSFAWAANARAYFAPEALAYREQALMTLDEWAALIE